MGSNSSNLKNENSNVLVYDQPDSKVPIVYDDIYNISFMKLEKLHPFDSCKWGKIVNILEGIVIIIHHISKFCFNDPSELTL